MTVATDEDLSAEPQPAAGLTPPTDGGTAVGSALGSPAERRRNWWVFGVVGAIVLVADQVSKAYVDAHYQLASLAAAPGDPTAPTQIIGDWVRIAKSFNHGGIFGLLGDSAPILGIASLFVIAVIVMYQARQGTLSILLSLTLGLLLGGALGNLADRLNHGYVIDFVDSGIGSTRWYTFNVADAAISVAIVLLVALSLLGDRLPGGLPAEPAASGQKR